MKKPTFFGFQDYIQSRFKGHMASKIQFGLKHTYFESCVLLAEIAFNCVMGNVYFSSLRPDFVGELWVEIIFWLFKVNSVKEACAKYFVVHILKFEILEIT